MQRFNILIGSVLLLLGLLSCGTGDRADGAAPIIIGGDSIPHDTIPRDTIPYDTVPHDTIPRDTIPTAATPPGWATVGGSVTGGGSATPDTVSTYADLKDRLASGSAEVIYVSGAIAIPVGGMITANRSDKTIVGLKGARLVSDGQTKSGSGILTVKNCSNIIIRNLIFEVPGAYDTDGNDLLCFDRVTNSWVDHCEFQDGVDGCFDIKSQTSYVAVTWCRFRYLKPPKAGGSGGSDDHRYCNLIGSSNSDTGDEGRLKITFQYCWWDEGCVERMPRVRFGQVHLVNNLFTSSVAKYCTRAGYKADLYVDKNAYVGVKNPVTNNSGDTFSCTFEQNHTAGTSGCDTPDEVAALSGYQGAAKWNPYATAGYALTTIEASQVQGVVGNAVSGAGATMNY
ncbi:MAG: chromophore lyase [Prevotellaceae bacterium]|nr:chromophore lyase [Prevotellaceae bacterium]